MENNEQFLSQILENSTCLYSLTDVRHALMRMATTMGDSLKQLNPVVLCALNGGIVTTGMLLPYLNFTLQLDYLHITRYGNSTYGKEAKQIATPRTQLNGRTVVVLDDILDGGITLSECINFCKNQGATSVYTAVLVNKVRKRESRGLAIANFSALSVPDKYVFGCGMDYKGYLRNAPGIYAIGS